MFHILVHYYQCYWVPGMGSPILPHYWDLTEKEKQKLRGSEIHDLIMEPRHSMTKLLSFQPCISGLYFYTNYCMQHFHRRQNTLMCLYIRNVGSSSFPCSLVRSKHGGIDVRKTRISRALFYNGEESQRVTKLNYERLATQKQTFFSWPRDVDEGLLSKSVVGR